MDMPLLKHISAFPARPRAEFVERWRRHIEKTGDPAGFTSVSTDKPPRTAQVILLSADIKVPVGKRGGERVPCPLCSPTRPKFETGRMAWFPEDQAVRFIGHTCAARYLGDNYREAERLFNVEQKCVEYQQLWSKIGPKLDDLADFLDGLLIPAKALQFTRDRLDERAAGFARFLLNDRIYSPGRLPFGPGHNAASGELKGLPFLATEFRPAREVEKARETLADLRRPLPAWTVDDGANADADTIVSRGRRATKMLDALPDLREKVAEAQKFLTVGNLRTLERWSAGGQSPFASLTFRWRYGKILLDAKTFENPFYCEMLVHPGFDAVVPKLPKGLKF